MSTPRIFRPYSPAEIELVKANYLTLGPEGTAALLGSHRKADNVRQFAYRRLGLRMPPELMTSDRARNASLARIHQRVQPTPEQEAYLLANWSSQPRAVTEAAMPVCVALLQRWAKGLALGPAGRAYRAAQAKPKPEKGPRKPSRMFKRTPQMLEEVARLWPDHYQHEIAKRLGIGRTTLGRYAEQLGLLGRPNRGRVLRGATTKPAPRNQWAPKPAKATAKPDYRVGTKIPCGVKRVNQRPAVKEAKKWYQYPMGSNEYKAGEAKLFEGKVRVPFTDEMGRTAYRYTNPS